MASLPRDPSTEGMWTADRLPGSFTFTASFTAAACYMLGNRLFLGGAVTGSLASGMYVNGAGVVPGSLVVSQNSDSTWNLTPQQQVLPQQTSFSVSAGVKLLPTVTNLKNGVLAYCTDVPGYAFWDSIGQLWRLFGSGGASAGPNNTPGFGGAEINFGALGGVVNDLAPGATWGSTNPTSRVKVVAASGNTNIHGVVATGAVNGNSWMLWNGSATDSLILNNDSATCPVPADRILCSGAGQIVIPPQKNQLIIRDGTLARWTV